MADDKWVTIILGILGLGITITLTLVGIIFSWLKGRIDKNEDKIDKQMSQLRAEILDRLRTLSHEDREQRSMIDGLTKIIIGAIRKGKKG